jgi:DNA-binding winged helix-turn-helix (wHTH) protein/TolB-like protein/Tfp pilus assembly protein PilF
MSKSIRRVYEFGPFRLDPSERLLLRDGAPVSLTPKAFDTLLILVENSGRLVLKDDLMKRLWPDTYVEEGGLTRNISVLRKLLGGESIDTQYIETLPKRGYRFVMSVRQFQGDELVIRRAKVRIVTEEEVDVPEAITAGTEGLSLPEGARSLAVLPFRLLGADAAEQYLGMGLTDVLITRLTNLRRIIVRPTSAVIHLSGLSQDAVSCGRQLQVEMVLEGTIQRLSDRIRVTVQLVGVDQAAPLWAEIFDEELADIFEIEDRVSEQLVAALTLKLTDAERRSLTKRYTGDTEAYQSYLRGRYFWNRRTPDGLNKAIECFRQAIDRDRDYALAHAGLADCYNMAGFWVYLPPGEAFPQAAAAAAEALALDDALGEAHASLAWARLHYDWERRTAEREYRRAIELNPGYVTAHQWYGLFLMQEARFDEALPELRRAQEIDPLSLAVAFNIGLFSIFTGRYAEATAQLKRTIELEPNYSIARNFLALSYWYQSMPDECLAEYHRCVELLRSSAHLAGLGLGYALTRRNAEARAVLDELEDGVSHAYVSPTGLAQVYVALGEKDRALECLERACDERDPWALWNKVNPVFESVRSEPRFQDLLRRVGLEP